MNKKLKKLYVLLDNAITKKGYKGVYMRFNTYQGFEPRLKRMITCHVITKDGGAPCFIYDVNKGILTSFRKDYFDTYTGGHIAFHNEQLRELADYIINEIGYDNFIFRYKKGGKHREIIIS